VPSDLITGIAQRQQTFIPPFQLSSLRTWIIDYIRMAQDSMKSRFDASHPLLEFVPGDTVLIKRPNSSPGLATKLLPKRFLAYVVSRINSNNYRIQFDKSDRYDVVHVQHLSPFYRRSTVSFSKVFPPSQSFTPPSPYAQPARSCLTKRPTPVDRSLSKIPVPKENLSGYILFHPTSAPQDITPPLPSPSRIPRPVRPTSLRPREVLRTPSRYQI
jgi:hypothetical protein